MKVDSNPALFHKYVNMYLLYSLKVSLSSCLFESMLGFCSEKVIGCSIILIWGIYFSNINLLRGIW